MAASVRSSFCYSFLFLSLITIIGLAPFNNFHHHNTAAATATNQNQRQNVNTYCTKKTCPFSNATLDQDQSQLDSDLNIYESLLSSSEEEQLGRNLQIPQAVGALDQDPLDLSGSLLLEEYGINFRINDVSLIRNAIVGFYSSRSADSENSGFGDWKGFNNDAQIKPMQRKPVKSSRLYPIIRDLVYQNEYVNPNWYVPDETTTTNQKKEDLFQKIGFGTEIGDAFQGVEEYDSKLQNVPLILVREKDETIQSLLDDIKTSYKDKRPLYVENMYQLAWVAFPPEQQEQDDDGKEEEFVDEIPVNENNPIWARIPLYRAWVTLVSIETGNKAYTMTTTSSSSRLEGEKKDLEDWLSDYRAVSKVTLRVLVDERDEGDQNRRLEQRNLGFEVDEVTFTITEKGRWVKNDTKRLEAEEGRNLIENPYDISYQYYLRMFMASGDENTAAAHPMMAMAEEEGRTKKSLRNAIDSLEITSVSPSDPFTVHLQGWDEEFFAEEKSFEMLKGVGMNQFICFPHTFPTTDIEEGDDQSYYHVKPIIHKAEYKGLNVIQEQEYSFSFDSTLQREKCSPIKQIISTFVSERNKRRPQTKEAKVKPCPSENWDADAMECVDCNFGLENSAKWKGIRRGLYSFYRGDPGVELWGLSPRVVCQKCKCSGQWSDMKTNSASYPNHYRRKLNEENYSDTSSLEADEEDRNDVNMWVPCNPINGHCEYCSPGYEYKKNPGGFTVDRTECVPCGLEESNRTPENDNKDDSPVSPHIVQKFNPRPILLGSGAECVKCGCLNGWRYEEKIKDWSCDGITGKCVGCGDPKKGPLRVMLHIEKDGTKTHKCMCGENMYAVQDKKDEKKRYYCKCKDGFKRTKEEKLWPEELNSQELLKGCVEVKN
eukprot:Nk52_evm7s1524 gene=Nk52_evmTU7s1524